MYEAAFLRLTFYSSAPAVSTDSTDYVILVYGLGLVQVSSHLAK
jgi:hypothetical protein